MPMNDTVLITFGCSWTYGIGAGYLPGMDVDYYENEVRYNKELCYEFSWRKIVKEHFNCDHINFSRGGSSNERQFRYAREFFCSNTWKKLSSSGKNIIVLWGITVTDRKYMWVNDENCIAELFLSDENILSKRSDRDKLSLVVAKLSYNVDHEIRELERNIKFWDNFFSMHPNVKNFWFDTFVTHEYKHMSPNMIYDKSTEFSTVSEPRRDLMHVICSNFNKKYNRRLNYFVYAVDNKLLNPYSFHPTRQSYKVIADFMIDKLKYYF